jgi:hypothetical protein
VGVNDSRAVGARVASFIKYLDISSALVDGDWGDEAVASPGNIDDEPIAVSSVAQRATQQRYGR